MDVEDRADARRPRRPLRRRLWQAANGLFFLAFAFSVIVQVNDPDPLPWMLLYGLAAAACALELAAPKLPGLELIGTWRRALPAGVAVAAAGWAAWIAPRVVGRVPFADMFGAFEMESVAVEESREVYGLLIVAAWMAVLAWRGGSGAEAGGGDAAANGATEETADAGPAA